jgi:GWxTD domain-containing protein
MLHNGHFLKCLLSLIFLSQLLMAQGNNRRDLSQTNVSYQYDLLSPITFDHRLALGPDEATVFIRLRERNINFELGGISYEVRENYDSEDVIQSGTIGTPQLILEEENSRYYRFSLPISENSNFLFIFVGGQIRNLETEYRYDIPLNTDQSFPLSDLLMMQEDKDIPVFENYLNKDDAFRLVSLYHDTTKAFVYYYAHDFEANPPPMAGAGADVQKSLEIDSIFPVQLNQRLNFENEGLYFAQLDTTSLIGISFRVEGPYFPRFVTAEKLVRPLRYISTSEEMDMLENNEDMKLALDKYWVKVTRSQERARQVIRDYYRQVTRANMLFSNYKEGWKTSQGMVYLLFGPPDIVYKSAGEERWIYEAESNLLENMSFTFVRVKNIFSNQHFNLLRDEEYRKFWYRNIDMWRKGRKQI